MKEWIYIAVDFDGTCVTHEYPYIGLSIGAEEVLKELAGAGHKLILNTMRSGRTLKDAQDWFRINEIPLFGVNNNPTQSTWTQSSKVYANLYLDDAAYGCPLVIPENKNVRSYVDWVSVRRGLVDMGLIKK